MTSFVDMYSGHKAEKKFQEQEKDTDAAFDRFKSSLGMRRRRV